MQLKRSKRFLPTYPRKMVVPAVCEMSSRKCSKFKKSGKRSIHLPMMVVYPDMFPFPIILGSKSPRRQELLKLMGVDFEILEKDVDESYPEGLNPEEVALYIAKAKANAFAAESQDAVIITADTLVALGKEILGKPRSE